jgi:hypothetical protein
MKTRTLTTLTALTLATYAVLPAHAGAAEVTLAWQEPGYVMEIVTVTGPRPKTFDAIEQAIASGASAMAERTVAAAAAEEVTLAWQEPGYIMEVVVVTAKRSEALANARRNIASRWDGHRAHY